MLIKQIFELREAWAPGRICTPITGCFQDKTIIYKENNRLNCYLPEVESSRTHFEVLGLGLEASNPRKLACPRLEDSSIFLNC